MKYMGNKNRISKEILPIMLKNRKEGQYFYDLFCGGCGICDKVDGNVIANDYHYYLIEMWKALQSGWIPPKEISKEDYIKAKNKKYKNDYEIGYIGFNGAYNGKFLGGYAGIITTKENTIRNYPLEAYKNVIKQLPKLQNVIFTNLSYDEVPLHSNSIIYLDPPYKSTTKYKTGSFNYEKFYQWCIDKHKEGHQVFISEYWLPESDFKCVWSKEVNSSLTQNTGAKKNVEKLFIVK